MQRIAILWACLLAAGIASHAEEFSRVTPVVKAVQKAGAAVVNISTERVETVVDPFFEFRRRFFQSPFEDPFERRYGTRTVRSLGSGVVVDPDGYIITNAHVVHGATKIMVGLQGEKEPREAVLVSTLPEKDLALLKIDAGHTLTVIEMGDSDTLMIGETTIALGNPFGLENTVTTGVVSATNREVYSEGNVVFTGLIQTDTAINPGNSGGALLDINGRLIGINTAIKQGAEGIGFAIPSNEVQRVMRDLLSLEQARGLWLGIMVADADGRVTVASVAINSPAARAGITAGAVLSAVNAAAVTDSFGFNKALIAASLAGEQISLTVNGRPVSVTPEKFGEALVLARCGFRGVDLTPWAARRLRITQTEGGVLVTEIVNGGAAAEIGLEVGDVLVKLAETRINGVTDLIEALRKAGTGQIDTIVVRGNQFLRGSIALR
ncbi:MAG: trypsin-like peptidase domain-containing protein [Planctomycetota bacterium]